MERYDVDLESVDLGVASEETQGNDLTGVEPGGKFPIGGGIAHDD